MIGTKLPAVICICPWYTVICGYAIQISNTTSDWKMRLQDWGDGSVTECLPWKHEDQRSDLRPPGGRQVWPHTPIIPVLEKRIPGAQCPASVAELINFQFCEGLCLKKIKSGEQRKHPLFISGISTHALVHVDTYAHTYKNWHIRCTHIHTRKERKYSTKR